MFPRGRHLAAVMGVALLAASAGAAPALADPQRGHREGHCVRVAGHVSATTTPVLDGGRLFGLHVVANHATGYLRSADTTGDLVVAFTEPDGTMHFFGAHHFVDPGKHLNLTTSDHVRFTTSGTVHDTLRVVDGGHGRLHTMGSADLATGAVELDVTGRICR